MFRFTGKLLLVFLSIAAAGFAQKDKDKFSHGAVTDYPYRQTVENVTIAAAPFVTAEEVKTAFGKLNPNEHGVLPVLLVVQNGAGETLSLERMEVELVTPDRDRIAATPASDVRYLRAGGRRPGVYSPPIPGAPPRTSRIRNPLDRWEIEGRAFAAQVLPPNETAGGFVYFRAPHRKGLTLLVKSIRNAQTGKELFYFEIPLDAP